MGATMRTSVIGFCLAAFLPGASAARSQEPAPGIAVLGSVVDVRGRPLSGASVQVHATRADGSVWSSVPCVVGESFELEGIPDGTLVLEARLDGYRTGTRALGQIQPDYVIFDARVVLTGAARLEGWTRTPAGTTLAGARVWVDDGRSVAATESDAQGRFTLEGLGPLPWTVWGAHGSEREPFLVQEALRTPPEGSLELLLQPPGALEVLGPRVLLLNAHPPDDFPAGYGEETATSTLWSRLPAGTVWVESRDLERDLGSWDLVTIAPGTRTTLAPTLAPLTCVRVRTFLERAGQRSPARARLTVRAESGWVAHEPSLRSCFPPEIEQDLWLPAGTFTLQAELDGARGEQVLSLQAGEPPRTLELALRR